MKVPKAPAADARIVRSTSNGPAISTSAQTTATGFPSRMLVYLIERFSLLTVVAASLLQYLFVAKLARGNLDLQNWARWLVGFCTYLGVFLALRFSDDMKDKAHDDQYYQERPVQRGLITLNELSASLAVLVILLTAVNALFSPPAAFALYLATMGYLVLMMFEFFIPQILRPRLLLYLVTHQLFVPLLAAYVIYHEGGRIAGFADAPVLVLVLLMIMAVEVARKIRPTYLDDTGRDTYSAYLGRTGAVCFLLGILSLAQVLFSTAARVPPPAGLLLLIPGLACGYYLWKDTKRSASMVLAATVLLLAVNMLVSL